MRFLSLLAVGIVALGIAVQPAKAVPLGADTGWATFSWSGGVGTAWTPAFDLTLTSTSELKVTDAFFNGDRFNVFANGSLLGETSAPDNDGSTIGDDYDAAFASASWSSATFILGPGTYTITGALTELATGFTSGGAALRVDTVVPLPATLLLMLGAFGLLGGVKLRSRRVAAA